jgi:flagellar motor switch/type III secretory pathway protein FliN
MGEPVELKCENQVVARGEVVVIEDKLGIQLTDVIRGG